MDERMKEIDDLQERIIEALGAAEAYNAVCRAMSYDDKREIFDYIFRMYDLAEGQED